MYSISFKKSAIKELESLPAKAVKTVSESIKNLAATPRPVGSKKLKGSDENLWRIRSGDYRVIYLIDDAIRIINIRRVADRKDVYK